MKTRNITAIRIITNGARAVQLLSQKPSVAEAIVVLRLSVTQEQFVNE